MASTAIARASESNEGIASAQAVPGPEKATSTLAWLLAVVAVGFGFLYTSLFSLTGTPHLRSGDEDFFWTYAGRLLTGQVFLRDFHQFTPPGTDLVYAAVFRVFGATVRSIDWTILWLGVALAVVCFFCARAIMCASMAALAAFACLVVLYGDRMDATHHWFSSLANLLALLALSRGRSWPRIAAAAALVAIAAFCTQTAGTMGLLACCTGLWWEQRIGRISLRTLWTRLAVFAGVTFGVWLLLSWRFIAQAGWDNYWFAQVAYLPRDANFPTGFLIPHFSASLYPRSLIVLADHVAVYLLLLLVCPWVASRCRRRPSCVALILLAALGIFQTLEVITMLNWNRMAAVAMPSVILCVWLITQMGSAERRVTMACWCIVTAMIVVQSGATQVRPFPRVTLPGGDALLDKDDVDEVAWLVAHTRPDDDFFEVANTRLYAPLGLRNPTPVDVLAPLDSTLPHWVDESVAALQRSATRYILWEPHTGIGRVEQRRQAKSDHLEPLRTYIEEQYVRVAVFANGDEMWARKE